ncbi:hypothetical protein POM88_042712 [Heracleum sosnowskyi]|uniref:RIN4 pathogenic type III effector avirulence factor Avr cleavage site domain-containing protein n=1 Tax=Heracleum sosnowskyi TaxID=360622 RepID=A0AAD8HIE4_9APIA|nr:hypothetical protein POM88_042712 [Heracleum sosnowskyi]
MANRGVALPKFGEWAGQGEFSVIFERARNDKKEGNRHKFNPESPIFKKEPEETSFKNQKHSQRDIPKHHQSSCFRKSREGKDPACLPSQVNNENCMNQQNHHISNELSFTPRALEPLRKPKGTNSMQKQKVNFISGIRIFTFWEQLQSAYIRTRKNVFVQSGYTGTSEECVRDKMKSNQH